MLAAVTFLTRIPVAPPSPMPASLGAAAFGLVGAGLGVVAAVPVVVLGERVPWIGALLALAILAALSGGLHLDGLADTADALVAPGPDRSERARKDPAVGAAGAVTLILVLALEAAALAQLAADPRAAAVTLVVAASWGRAASVLVALGARRTATGEGLGAGFAGGLRGLDGVLAAAVAVALLVPILLEGSLGAVAGVAIGMALGLGVASVVVRARHALDGDGLGAAVVLAELAVLVVGAIAMPAVAAS
jgi:adenosylcobinamide-GDP ribazoletransferase